MAPFVLVGAFYAPVLIPVMRTDIEMTSRRDPIFRTLGSFHLGCWTLIGSWVTHSTPSGLDAYMISDGSALLVKIVLVTTASAVGGVLTHIVDLAAELRMRGHDVIIALPRDAVRSRDLIMALGVPMLDLDEAVRARADVWHLHAHSTFDRSALKLHLQRRLRAASVVLTEHLPRAAVSDPSIPWDPNSEGRPRPGAMLAKSLLKRAQVRSSAAVIVVASASKDFMVRRYRVDPNCIHVVHNGVRSPPAVTEAELVEGRPLRIVAIGTLGWRKGFDVLIAASALAERAWTVDVIGDGDLRSDLEEQAARAGGRVRFVGYRANAANSISDYEVLCLPTRGEAFPYVTLEAMVRQRPVVASRVDGVGELVRDGVNGLLVRPEDPTALAAALDNLAMDRALCRRLGSKAREMVETQFTVDAMVCQTLDVYKGCNTARKVRAH